MATRGTLTCFLGLAASLAGVACGGAGMTAYEPVREKTKIAPDTLQTAARDAVEDLGYQTVSVDTASHTFDTREKEVAVSSIPRLSYKYAFHVDTTDGVLSIVASCTQNSAVAESKYEDCGDDRPQRVVKAQREIKKRILAQAPTIEAKNPDWASLEHPPPDEDEDEKKPEAKEKGKADAKKADAKKADAKKADAKKAD